MWILVLCFVVIALPVGFGGYMILNLVSVSGRFKRVGEVASRAGLAFEAGPTPPPP